MPITLLTADCPAVYVPSGFVDLDAAENPTGAGGANILRKVHAGQVEDVAKYLNRNAASQELIGRYGGGVNAIAQGIDLSAGISLTAAVAQGHAVLSGGVHQVNATTILGLANNARNYVWRKDNLDGTFGFATATTTARPTNAVLFLGSVLTASGAVVSVDQSGVIYLRGGLPYRETADPGAPTDSPPASIVLLHRTLGGLYLWDGTEWSRAYSELAHQATSVATGQTEVIPAGRQAVIHGTFDVDGTLDIYGDLIVLD